MHRKTQMTDASKTTNGTAQMEMMQVPGASFSAHYFKGDVLSTAASVAMIASQCKPANHAIPTILQQMEMYLRIKRARGE